MDKTSRWIEKEELKAVAEKTARHIGGKLAACTWIYSKTVVCNGQSYMEAFRSQKTHSIMEAINWVCPSAQDNHAWTSEFSLVLNENKTLGESNYDIEFPCMVQWGLLWYVAPSSLNNNLLNDGVIREM